MHLFIDTNVYLSFFHFSSDDLEELRKLAVLVRNGTITLLVPDQVRSEFRRNRDGTIADALKRLRELKFAVQFPQLCKEYEQYEAYRAALRAAEAAKSQLLEVLEADVEHSRLKADGVIAELFRHARRVAETDALLARARDRMVRGNPPGKKKTHGDALNWESLIETVDNRTDLFFVSGDGDWVSPLNDELFDSFLTHEWEEKKGSSLRFYRRLSAFLREHFRDINLATEEEKDHLIQDLSTSGNFARSRRLLRQLVGHGDFTPVQLNGIARAATTNNQIYWIMSDPDIARYIRALLGPGAQHLEADLLAEVERLLGGQLNEADGIQRPA